MIAIDLSVGAASANVRMRKDVTTMPKNAAAAAPVCGKVCSMVMELLAWRAKTTRRAWQTLQPMHAPPNIKHAALPITLVLLLGASAVFCTALWT